MSIRNSFSNLYYFISFYNPLLNTTALLWNFANNRGLSHFFSNIRETITRDLFLI